MNRYSFLAPFLALVLVMPRTGFAVVTLGIDELENSNFAELEGKRVGLVTNPAGVDSEGRSAIDVLYGHRNFKLVKLFGPEHGIDGKSKAGESVSHRRDRKTGLMVYSLYGDTRRPTESMLQGLDVIVYDLQDLGCRSYTFISTLGYVMEAASSHGIEVVVLDRPDPLGGLRMEGPRRNESLKSFIGLYDIPYVYGLTPGELAQWINVNYLPHPCKLTVVKMRGWRRSMVWEDTGLKWMPTSPNIPTIEAARGYVATGFLGEVGLGNGVGGPKPFTAIGGPGWDMLALCARMNSLNLNGIHAIPYSYKVKDGRWAGSETDGAYLQIDPHFSDNLTAISFYAIQIFQDIVDRFTPFAHTTADQKEMFDKITGIPTLRRQILNGTSAQSIIHSWDAGVKRWSKERRAYMLYDDLPIGDQTVTGPLPAGANISTE